MGHVFNLYISALQNTFDPHASRDLLRTRKHTVSLSQSFEFSVFFLITRTLAIASWHLFMQNKTTEFLVNNTQRLLQTQNSQTKITEKQRDNTTATDLTADKI